MNIDLQKEAVEFITNCYTELGKTTLEIGKRIEDVCQQIQKLDSYDHTHEELQFGAKLAWRNSNRCIGRLFWDSLSVFDRRHLYKEEDVYKALLNHIDFATNQGRIRPTITIFKPSTNQTRPIQILNHQLIRYAGYETEHGVIGDPHSIEFTTLCQRLGWKGANTHFDILPIVIQIEGKSPKWFEIPREKIIEVPLIHPSFQWFEDLQIKWYAVPIISDMRLEIGGISYHAAPFNGWYMGTEIGARNLADEFRYNLLPKIADLMGLNTKHNSTLWKDRALIELNTAVLHSYKQAGVSIVDHHTAAQQFELFEQKEKAKGRRVTGEWSWLIPPVSPAATHIFHNSYENDCVTPNFFYKKE